MTEFDVVKATLDLIKGLQATRIIADNIEVTEYEVKMTQVHLWDPPSIDLVNPTSDAEWFGHGIPPENV